MANTQIVNKPNLYVDNLQVSWASNTTLSGTSGAARDSTNVFDIEIAATKTINGAVNGLNGLDQGTLAASTFYAVHVIGDSTLSEPGGYLLSTSATAPTLPFGYDTFRRIGWVKTDGSVHFLLFYQSGKGKDRRYYYDIVTDTGTTSGTTTFVAQSLATIVPSTSRVAIMNNGIVPNAAGNALFVRVTGSTATSAHMSLSGSVATKQNTGIYEVPLNSAQSYDYKTDSASDTAIMTVIGYLDSL